MEQLINVELEDIIRHQQDAPNFNNEVIVIKLDGNHKPKRDERIQINAFSLILVLNGVLDININGRDYHVTSKAFLDVIDIHAVQNLSFSSDFEGYHLIVSHTFMAEAMKGIKRLSVCNFLSRCEDPVMKIDNMESILLDNIMLNILKNIDRTNHIYQRDLVKNEIRSLLIEASNIIVQKGKVRDVSLFKSKDDIIAQFVVMVTRHCTNEHSVSFYANELCIEPKYLSRILKGRTGKTANRWIDDAIMIEAKTLLKDHDMTIQQIVDSLHFSDQSAFGKFFKKHCTVSPLNYRRQQSF